MPSAAAQQRTLNKKLSQIFRMRGLAVSPDAMQPLYDVLQGDEGWEQTLQAVLHELQRQDLKSGQVDADAIRTAISALRQRVTAKPKLALEVIDAFSMPSARFDKQRKTLVPEHGPPSLHAAASAKAAMHAQRLALVEQRVRRHDIFKPPVLANGVAPKEHLELTGIDALLGRSGVRVVLGLLAEMEDGCFGIEDAHAAVPIDLSEAAVTPGLFTRHAIVLAEGEVLPSGVFKIRQLGFPPPESIQLSNDSLGGFDLLHPSASSPTSVVAAPSTSTAAARGGGGGKAAQIATENAMLIVLSDVWLDSPAVLKNLATLFEGYEFVGKDTVGSGRAAVPRASFFTFVLCGNFTSNAVAAPSAVGSRLKGTFKDLATLLAKTPTLATHAHFVLVAGPDDPTLSTPDVLPRAGLARSLCTDLLQTLGHCELVSSPARIVLCEQTIVVHREELLVKARRACILPPNTEVRRIGIQRAALPCTHTCDTIACFPRCCSDGL